MSFEVRASAHGYGAVFFGLSFSVDENFRGWLEGMTAFVGWSWGIDCIRWWLEGVEVKHLKNSLGIPEVFNFVFYFGFWSFPLLQPTKLSSL
jgi:hypothetical protein